MTHTLLHGSKFARQKFLFPLRALERAAKLIHLRVRLRAGRGAWLCRDSPGCIDEAVRKKAFGRALRARVEPCQVEAIRVELGSSSHQLPEPGSESPVL